MHREDLALEKLLGAPSRDRLGRLLTNLFECMAKGEPFGADDVLRFNGGLFADSCVFDLTPADIDELLKAAHCDWSSVEPTIFGCHVF